MKKRDARDNVIWNWSKMLPIVKTILSDNELKQIAYNMVNKSNDDIAQLDYFIEKENLESALNYFWKR